MDQLVNEIIEVPYEDLVNYELPVGYPFGLITYLKGVKYEFIIHLKEDSERMIFLGSGALNMLKENDRSRPHFNRWSWSAKFKESFILYNDPTLYIDNFLTGGLD